MSTALLQGGNLAWGMSWLSTPSSTTFREETVSCRCEIAHTFSRGSIVIFYMLLWDLFETGKWAYLQHAGRPVHVLQHPFEWKPWVYIHSVWQVSRRWMAKARQIGKWWLLMAWSPCVQSCCLTLLKLGLGLVIHCEIIRSCSNEGPWF